MGLHFIKRKKWRAHRASMLSAFGFSSLFLISCEPLAITRQSGCIEKRPARLVKRRRLQDRMVLSSETRSNLPKRRQQTKHFSEPNKYRCCLRARRQ
jgi:hypothetical protein